MMVDSPGSYIAFGLIESPFKTAFWQEFETGAICVKSDGSNKILGTLKWGHSFKDGKREWDYGEGKDIPAGHPSWNFENLLTGISVK